MTAASKASGLFGSIVRNEQTALSDIDLLLDINPEMDTFDNYMCACDLLEEMFAGMKLDIVTRNDPSPFIGTRILEEVQYVEQSNVEKIISEDKISCNDLRSNLLSPQLVTQH